MLTEYRKQSDSDTWHFCTNCSNWPTTAPVDAVAMDGGRPGSGELCDECLSKEKRGTCNREVPINVEGGKQVNFSKRTRKRKTDKRKK